MKKYISIAIISILFLSGCRNRHGFGRHKRRIGHLVTPLAITDTIYYKCGKKEAKLNRDGEFSCDSFPISFFTSNLFIGSISSLHSDGYVFPQDMDRLKVALN